ncbi:MAG: hypothetical protein N3F11_11365 [Casimicrobiaceae bacterium]|nr:hypothetical protein [Casimicrobiaceae bacterium]
MTWFLYFACTLTGVLSGGAFGYLIGFLLFPRQKAWQLAAGVAGAVLLTLLLLRFARWLQRTLNERG